MATLREWIIRLWGTLDRGRKDGDLEQELRFHVERAAEDLRPGRPSLEIATRAAAVHAGAIAQTMEVLRDQRGLPWLDDLARDVRHACRLLRRNPVFTGVAVISLAIGIGANGAIFSLTDELILRPLPVRDPAAVVTVSADAPDQGFGGGGRMSYPNYRDLRDSSQSFDGLLAYQISTASFARSRETVREMRMGMLVSDNFFDVLGVQPALGRTFTREEGQAPGRDAVVVLSYDFWKNALAADTSDSECGRLDERHRFPRHRCGAGHLHDHRAAVAAGVLRTDHDGAAPERGAGEPAREPGGPLVFSQGPPQVRRVEAARAGRAHHALERFGTPVSAGQPQSDDGGS